MRSTRILLVYHSTEGQTRKVADRIAATMRRGGATVDAFQADDAPAPAGYDSVVIGDAIHVDRHSRELARYAASHTDELGRRPVALFQVSLTSATDDDAHREQARRLIGSFVASTGLTPRLVALFAGALPYTRHGLLTRLRMRRVARRMGADMDMTRDHEYTDWDAVERFAWQVLATFRSSRPDRAEANGVSDEGDRLLALLGRALPVTRNLVAGVANEQWDDPTPCDEMTVLGVVEHLVSGLNQFAATPAAAAPPPPGDQVLDGRSALREFDAASERMLTVWSGPGVTDRSYSMPWGETPGEALLGFALIEQLVHGWDLARASGRAAAYDDDVALGGLDAAREHDDPSIRVPGMFGPAVPIADDAPPIDQLAAFLGRHVPLARSRSADAG